MKMKLKCTNYRNKLLAVLTASIILIFACVFFINHNLITDNVAEAKESNDSLEFVYQPATDVFVGDTIDVCIGFNDKEEHPDATLSYHKIGSDQTFVSSVSYCADEMVFFEIESNSNEEIGSYLYDDVTWYDNDSQTYVKQKIEENTSNGYSFSINGKVDDVNNTSIPASVYSITENGLQEISDTSDSSQTQMLLTQEACINKYQECLATGNSFVVALDAGHGGSEPGACYGGHAEKDLNWRIACACQNELTQYAGVSVFQCRNGDEYVGLQERVERARSAGANLFVCLHNNSGGGSGCEVWVQHSGGWHSEFNSIGCDIGNRINSKLSATFGFANRGLKERYCTDGSMYPDGSAGDYFTVLYWSRYYSIPGILVEHAFMDGPWADQNALYNDANLDTMGRLDAEAIAEYYGFQKNAPVPYVKRMEDGKATLEWKSIPNAEKYAIAKYENGSYYTYTLDCHDTSYTIDNLTNGEEYTFLVQAYVGGKWSQYTEKNHLTFRLLPCPSTSAYVSGDGEITLSWQHLSGASKYAIAQYIDGKYVTLTDSFPDQSGTMTYKVDNLECGIEHQFLVQGWINGQWWSYYDENYHTKIVAEGHEKPYQVVSVPNVFSCDLSWHSVPGALSYAIAVLQPDGKWKTLTYDCTETRYTITGLSSGHSYTALVQAKFRNDRYSTFDESDYILFDTVDIKPHVQAEAGGDGEVKLSWSNPWELSKFSVNEYKDGKLINITESCATANYTVTNLSNEFEHKFVVLAYFGGQWTDYDKEDIVACTPHGHTKPYDVEAVSPTVESITLQWTHVSGAVKYAIASKGADGKFKTYTYDCTTPTYTVHNLQDSTDYKFLVQAYIEGNWTQFTDADLVEATTIDFRPKPSVQSTGDGSVQLVWDEVQDATKYAIAEKIGDSFKTFTTECSSLNYNVTNLANGYEHTFLVQAYYNGKWSRIDSSRYVSATPTGHIKPYDVSASPTSKTIRLSWHSVPGAEKYAIATKNADSTYTTYTYDCVNTNYEIKGLVDGINYSCLVQAYINGKWSSFTDDDLVKATTKTNRPKAKVASSGDGTVTLTWDAVTDATKYAIAVVKGTEFETRTLECTNTSYTVDNLANEKSHSFLVQAYVDDVWSPYNDWNYVSGTPHGHIKPYDVETSSGYSTIALSWHSVPGASCYAVATKNDDGKYTTYTYDCAETSYVISGLQTGKTYYCLVQAKIDGNWSAFSSSDLVEATTLNTRPQARVDSVGDGTATLKWDAIGDATKYAIAEYKNGSYITYTYECQTTTYTVSNLANGKSHTLLVQAYVEGSWSPFDQSDFVKATPQGPIKPTITNVTPGINALTVNWNYVAGASKYAIAVSTDAGSTFKTYSYNCTENTFTVSGLRAGTEYWCLVQANIDGAWSRYDSSDLVKAVPTSDPTRPRPTVTGTEAGAVSLSWDAIPNASKYAVATKNSDGTYTTYVNDLTSTSYTIRGLAGGTYYILVQAYVNNKWSAYDDGDLVEASVPLLSGVPIMSAARSYVAQMVRYYNSTGHSYPSGVYASKGATTITDWCQICYEEATTEGVDPAVLFCQAMIETGWLQFGGRVQAWQCNFGGMGATDSGGTPATFPDVRTGLRAQSQHLKAYASTADLVNPCVDPRFRYVTRGCAPCVEDLSGKWASGADYGQKIVNLMNVLFTK